MGGGGGGFSPAYLGSRPETRGIYRPRVDEELVWGPPCIEPAYSWGDLIRRWPGAAADEVLRERLWREMENGSFMRLDDSLMLVAAPAGDDAKVNKFKGFDALLACSQVFGGSLCTRGGGYSLCSTNVHVGS